jgi:hypothetical protein
VFSLFPNKPKTTGKGPSAKEQHRLKQQIFIIYREGNWTSEAEWNGIKINVNFKKIFHAHTCFQGKMRNRKTCKNMDRPVP